MTNQLSIPPSNEFPGELVTPYKYLLPLYQILTGSDQFEIPVHFSGSVEIDNDLWVHSTLTVGDPDGWDISVSGLDLIFKDGTGTEVIRFCKACCHWGRSYRWRPDCHWRTHSQWKWKHQGEYDPWRRNY